MIIGGVDRQELQRQKNRDSRASISKIVEEIPTSKILPTTTVKRKFKSHKNNDDKIEPDLKEPNPPAPLELAASTNANVRNLANLPVLAKTLDRYGVSDRAGAAIASAVLKDYGIIEIGDNQNDIARHKVRRASDNERQILQDKV